MSDYQVTPQTRVRQAHERGRYDRAFVHSVLDEAYVAHVGFMYESAPIVIPMFHVRDGERVLLHGSRKARFFRTLATGIPLCISVTLIDGLVLARSAFHHSMNYRSVIVQGSASVLEGDDRLAAADLLVEKIEKGRADQARRVNGQEDKATMIIALPLEQVSAKMRSGGPKDDEEDMDLPVWAGVIPFETVRGEPISD